MKHWEIFGLRHGVLLVSRRVWTKEYGRAIHIGMKSLKRIFGDNVEWIGTKLYQN